MHILSRGAALVIYALAMFFTSLAIFIYIAIRAPDVDWMK